MIKRRAAKMYHNLLDCTSSLTRSLSICFVLGKEKILIPFARFNDFHEKNFFYQGDLVQEKEV